MHLASSTTTTAITFTPNDSNRRRACICLQWPVDEIAGTGVDTLVLGLGYSDVYFHRSKVGRVVGQGKQTWDSYIDWRILRMVEAGQSLDADQLRANIDRGRELGVRVIPSLKLQDVSPPGDERCGLLKEECGADICIGEEGRYLWGYDWMHAEVAEGKLAVVREVLDDYEADGIELDFMFDLRYFKRGATEAGARHRSPSWHRRTGHGARCRQ